MSEAVPVPSLTLVTSTVSEESLARGTRTHFGLVYLKHFSKVVSDFENKKKKRKKFIQYDQKVDKKGEEN